MEDQAKVGRLRCAPLPTGAALGVCAGRRSHSALVAAALAGAMLAASAQPVMSAACKPSHFRPIFFVKTMGPCAFDPSTLSFQGSPVEQAECLMRGMNASRNLVPKLENLPAALAGRIGNDTGLPSRETLSAFLSSQNLEWDFAAYLWQPVSHANDNDESAPTARYFVIHDTSGPNYGHRPFPADVDANRKINSLYRFECSDGWGKAHVVVNRFGDMLLSHELAIPWRETRFEQAANFSGALKGLFLHVELVQPRRSAAGRGWRNDAQSPDPAFTSAQYDRLALVYVIASARAQHWLIPAFHAAIDADIRNGHDDPLNFDIESFAKSLEALAEKLNGPPEAQAAIPVSAGETAAAPRPLPSAMPVANAAEVGPSPPSLLVKANDTAQGSAENSPESQAETGPAPRRKDEPRVAHKSETKNERKKHEGEMVGAEHCKTLVAKSHRRRFCWTSAVKQLARRNGPHLIRSLDHRVSHHGDRARHHRRDLHPRHARDTS